MGDKIPVTCQPRNITSVLKELMDETCQKTDKKLTCFVFEYGSEVLRDNQVK